MFKDMKLGYKLIGAFVVMALIVALTGSFGIWSINRVVLHVKDMMMQRASQEKLVLLLEVTQKGCRHNLVEGALVRTEKAEFDAHVAAYRKKNQAFHSYLDILQKGDPRMGVPPASTDSTIEEHLKAVRKSWGEFEKVADELIAHKAMLLKGLNTGVVDQRAKDALADEKLNLLARNSLSKASEDAKLDIDDMADTVEGRMLEAGKEAFTIRTSATIAFLSVIVAAVLFAVFLGFMAARNILRRVENIAKALNQGAQGDLAVTVPVDSADELGRLSGDFNRMGEKLSEMVNSVKSSTKELTAVSEDVYAVSRKVIDAAELQAGAVNQTSAAVMEISASAKEVAQGVEGLSISASESSASVLEMAASVEEVAINAESLAMSVDEVSSSIMEMAASIRQIGEGVQTLQNASDTMASSVAQMDSSISQVEESANHTAAISNGVLRDAEEGNASVEATIAGIHEIRRSSLITAEVINTLSTKAEDIGDILSVIDEVTEQTSLLALNAAIIAAQAGEHGKGFAVVADEIKELAERTQSSTREIAQVVSGVQEETRRAVEAINAAEKSINDGVTLSKKSGEALGKIVSGTKRASGQVNEIAGATVEQAKGSRMIREAMEQVSEMIGQMANATKEQGKGSELIMTAAERMKDLTTQVNSSTSEQSKVGKLIARSTEDITDTIRQIKRACDEQALSSDLIVRAVENIQGPTGVNLESAKVLDDAVGRLSRLIKVLQQEMAGFKVVEGR